MDRLRISMRDKSLTQMQLQDLSGISQGAISDYLKGKSEPKSDALYRLSRIFNVSMEWLWGGEEPVIPETGTPQNDLLSAKKEIIRLKNKLRSARKTLEGSYKLALEALKIEETEKEKK